MGFALEKRGEAECSRIAAEMFTVEKIYGSKLTGRCPIHGDKNSASFYYKPDKDSFGCSGCGAYGDLIKLYSAVNGLDNKTDGFKAFCREYGITGKGPDAHARRNRKPPPPPAKPKGTWKKGG